MYLPAGIWTDILTGEQYEGGRFIRRTCSFLEMPILARPDHIIVYGNFDGDSDYDYVQDADAVIYSLGEGRTARADICSSRGEREVTITAENRGGTITVRTTPTPKIFTVRLHRGGAARLGGTITEATLRR